MIPWPWPAPVDDGGAAHLMPGLAIPDIPLPTTAGGEVSFARLSGRTIVFVYTWTGRPGDFKIAWSGTLGRPAGERKP